MQQVSVKIPNGICRITGKELCHRVRKLLPDTNYYLPLLQEFQIYVICVQPVACYALLFLKMVVMSVISISVIRNMIYYRHPNTYSGIRRTIITSEKKERRRKRKLALSQVLYQVLTTGVPQFIAPHFTVLHR